MAREAIDRIKAAEEKAADTVRRAQEEAREIVRRAGIEAEAAYEKTLAEAEREREAVLSGAEAGAREAAAPVLSRGKEEAERAANPPDNVLLALAETVAQRIAEGERIT